MNKYRAEFVENGRCYKRSRSWWFSSTTMGVDCGNIYTHPIYYLAIKWKIRLIIVYITLRNASPRFQEYTASFRVYWPGKTFIYLDSISGRSLSTQRDTQIPFTSLFIQTLHTYTIICAVTFTLVALISICQFPYNIFFQL
jgi:hypothetical protein